MKRYGKVAVLMGGSSSEREVSLMSGAGVLAALRLRQVDAHPFDPAEKPLTALKEEGFDRVFIILHGPFGEDGTLQGALETMGMPYTGCGVMASAIGMDKWRTKLLWQAIGLPVPQFMLLDDNTNLDQVVATLGLPLFVKPACEGSSFGVSKVKKASDLRHAYEAARKYDALVLAERFIGGGEYTCAILGDRALPPVKIEPATEFYDYEAKYFRDDTVYRCPAGLPAEVEARVLQMAIQAFRVIGGTGWGRVDFLMDEAGQPCFLEINTAPGMTSHSLVPMAARQAGMSYEDLCMAVLDLAHVG